MTTQEIFDLAMHTLETVQRITKLGGTEAGDALSAVEAAVDTFIAIKDSPSSVVPADATAIISSFHSQLATNDAAVDATPAKK